jgi:hypothetical protein
MMINMVTVNIMILLNMQEGIVPSYNQRYSRHADMQICRYADMQICGYADIHRR